MPVQAGMDASACAAQSTRVHVAVAGQLNATTVCAACLQLGHAADVWRQVKAQYAQIMCPHGYMVSQGRVVHTGHSKTVDGDAGAMMAAAPSLMRRNKDGMSLSMSASARWMCSLVRSTPESSFSKSCKDNDGAADTADAADVSADPTPVCVAVSVSIPVLVLVLVLVCATVSIAVLVPVLVLLEACVVVGPMIKMLN